MAAESVNIRWTPMYFESKYKPIRIEYRMVLDVYVGKHFNAAYTQNGVLTLEAYLAYLGQVLSPKSTLHTCAHSSYLIFVNNGSVLCVNCF